MVFRSPANREGRSSQYAAEVIGTSNVKVQSPRVISNAAVITLVTGREISISPPSMR